MLPTSRLDWFHAARYGLFLHWGPYSVAGRGEWALNREGIPFDEYEARYVRPWKAENYDPAAWAALARDAGMKYVVLTTRHHDGFCLWDTKTTGWNSVAMGPGRDLIRPFVDAVRAAGLKVGLYYSITDWHHPDFPDPYVFDYTTRWEDEAKRQRFVAFYHAQLEELLTGYGPIDLLWYDMGVPEPLDGERVNADVRRWQPGILINDRNGLSDADFRTAEQSLTPYGGGQSWEGCITLNDSWGFHAGDDNWRDARHLVGRICTAAGRAGNLLLNVGPRPDGTIPEPAARILREAGDWLRRNGEWLPNSERHPYSWVHGTVLTARENSLYANIFYSPGAEFALGNLGNRVQRARLLATGADLPFEQRGDRVIVRGLPQPWADPIGYTLALDLDGSPRLHRPFQGPAVNPMG